MSKKKPGSSRIKVIPASLRESIWKLTVYAGKIVIDSLSDNDGACGELLMELVDYLPKRYPTLFTRDGYDTITNHVFGERHEGLSKKRGVEALHVIAR